MKVLVAFVDPSAGCAAFLSAKADGEIDKLEKLASRDAANDGVYVLQVSIQPFRNWTTYLCGLHIHQCGRDHITLAVDRVPDQQTKVRIERDPWLSTRHTP